MAGVAFVTIRDVRPADQVPNSNGATVVARYSAVVMNGAALVKTVAGDRGVTDTAFVSFTGTDTTATVQAAVLTQLKGAGFYNDGTITAQYL